MTDQIPGFDHAGDRHRLLEATERSAATGRGTRLETGATTRRPLDRR